MSSAETRYVPAAGRRAFTRLYDPVVAMTMRESTFRGQLLEQVLDGLDAGGTVVDVGCGTGTLAIQIARAAPAADVIGFDGDPEILGLARAKDGAEQVEWHAGLAGELPLEDASVDRVVMSLLLHHLDPATKRRALADAARVLAPGGRLHVADWGRPSDPLARATFFALQLFDGFTGTRDHAAGRLPDFITAAGLEDVHRHATIRTAWGTLELLRAVKP